MNIYLVIFITLVAALIASFSQLAFKKSMHKRIEKVGDLIEIAKRPRMIAGILGYFLSLGVYLFALKSAPLSFVYPTFASTFIFIFLISTFTLKEQFNAKRALGVALVFIGIVIIGFSL